jgi:hypothetical protein
MNFCSDGHGEVCYEGRNCPACVEMMHKDDQIRLLEDKIEKLESDATDLRRDISELEEM